MSDEIDYSLYLSGAAKALRHAMALLEHAYGIGSYEAFRELPEMTQRAYLAAVYEHLLQADAEIDRLRDFEPDPRRNPVEVTR